MVHKKQIKNGGNTFLKKGAELNFQLMSVLYNLAFKLVKYTDFFVVPFKG